MIKWHTKLELTYKPNQQLYIITHQGLGPVYMDGGYYQTCIHIHEDLKDFVVYMWKAQHVETQEDFIRLYKQVKLAMDIKELLDKRRARKSKGLV